jgi:hypothetical protein
MSARQPVKAPVKQRPQRRPALQPPPRQKDRDEAFERGAKAIMKRARDTGKPFFPFGEPVFDE